MATHIFRPSRQLEDAYRRITQQVAQQALNATAKVDSKDGLRIVLQDFGNSASFQFSSINIAAKMVRSLDAQNLHSWKHATKQSNRIYRLLREEVSRHRRAIDDLIYDNARVIRGIPVVLANRVSYIASEAAVQGMRPAAIMDEIRKKLPQYAEAHLRMIARTEVAKSQSAITQARAQSIGITHYRWLTAEDGRVRISHRAMDKVVCPFDDKPNPETLAGEKSIGSGYGPGETYNCRCVAIPIITMLDVTWPARVYSNGAIRRMSRAQFLNLIGFTVAA